ncbi:MAG: hypothetical protein LBV19_07045 [Streptococcaceae bacterium]|jgi:hypothetical protein|nr:hypothetical protein [Streptococcaceae bacterium]
MTKIEYIINAAKLSKGSAALWVRYLNKVINENSSLSQTEVAEILTSKALDSFQRVILKLAVEPDNDYHRYIVNLSKPRKVLSIEERLQKYGL